MNKQTVYTNGLFFNKPHEKAPEYVIGGLAVHVERFHQWLSEQEVDEKGYVKIDIMEGR